MVLSGGFHFKRWHEHVLSAIDTLKPRAFFDFART